MPSKYRVHRLAQHRELHCQALKDVPSCVVAWVGRSGLPSVNRKRPKAFQSEYIVSVIPDLAKQCAAAVATSIPAISLPPRSEWLVVRDDMVRLGAFRPGIVYANGNPTWALRAEEAKFSLDIASIRDAQVDAGGTAPLRAKPLRLSSLPIDLPPDAHGSWVLLCDARRVEGGTQSVTLVLPCQECFRFAAAGSSTFLQKVISNGFALRDGPPTGLYPFCKVESARASNDVGTDGASSRKIYLELVLGLTMADGRRVARLLVEPEFRTALFHAWLSLQGNTSPFGKRLYCPFPFGRVGTITVCGVPRENGYFWTHEIRKVTSRPYDEILVKLANDSTKGERRAKDLKEYQRPGERRSPRAEGHESSGSMSPGPSHPFSLQSGIQDSDLDDDVTVRPPKKEVQHFQRLPPLPGERPLSREVAVGGDRGRGLIDRVNVVGSSRLMDSVNRLHLLKRIVLAIAEKAKPNHTIEIEPFPGTDADGLGEFPFADSVWVGNDNPRRCYAAWLLRRPHVGRSAVVVEIERKRRSESHREAFCYGCLGRTDGQPLDGTDLLVVLGTLASRRGVWPKDIRGIDVVPVRHVPGMDGPWVETGNEPSGEGDGVEKMASVLLRHLSEPPLNLRG